MASSHHISAISLPLLAQYYTSIYTTRSTNDRVRSTTRWNQENAFDLFGLYHLLAPNCQARKEINFHPLIRSNARYLLVVRKAWKLFGPNGTKCRLWLWQCRIRLIRHLTCLTWLVIIILFVFTRIESPQERILSTFGRSRFRGKMLRYEDSWVACSNMQS